MVLPERNNFIEEIEYINSKDIKDKLILLYDYVKGIGKKDIDKYKILKDVLDKLFNPYDIYNDTIIPFSFFQTAAGKLVVTILNGANEKNYTIADLAKLTKTKERANGYSIQYLTQEIKAGRINAIKDSGRWVITEMEVDRFLKAKGII